MTCTRCDGKGYFTLGKWPHQYQCQACFGQAVVPSIKYAGIGWRETPMVALTQMELLGSLLGARRFVLRSGGAKGADTAFHVGCKAVNGMAVIRTASPKKEWMEHAARYHPVWDTLPASTQALHARNSAIMLGDDLDDPVAFVVCYTDGGGAVGGTGQALRIAADPAYAIPMFNLFYSDAMDRLWSFVADRGL